MAALPNTWLKIYNAWQSIGLRREKKNDENKIPVALAPKAWKRESSLGNV